MHLLYCSNLCFIQEKINEQIITLKINIDYNIPCGVIKFTS